MRQPENAFFIFQAALFINSRSRQHIGNRLPTGGFGVGRIGKAGAKTVIILGKILNAAR